MAQAISQVQIKRSSKTLDELAGEKLKYGEPLLLVNDDNKALVLGNPSENDNVSKDYFIPLEDAETMKKGYMVKGVDYVTAGQASGTTVGEGSTAEGKSTVASGNQSHAEGFSTTASGTYAHAEGRHTIANHKSQHVFGEYNVVDDSTQPSTSKGEYVEIVGNGANDTNRSNARTLDWDGNEVLAGKLTLGQGPTQNMDAATKEYVDQGISGVPQGTVTHVGVTSTTPINTAKVGNDTTSVDYSLSLADQYGDIKNPYGSKPAKQALMSPLNNAGVPSFRSLNAEDITGGTLPIARGGTGQSGYYGTGGVMTVTPASSTQPKKLTKVTPKVEGTFAVPGRPYFVLCTPQDNNWTDCPIEFIECYKYQEAYTYSSITLLASNWRPSTSGEMVLTVNNAAFVTSTSLVQVFPAPVPRSNILKYSQFGVWCTDQGDRSLSFTCIRVPDADITVQYVVW